MVRILRIWTGVPDVVYLAESFKLCLVVFLDVSPLQTCVSLKLSPSETDDSRFNSREKRMPTDSVQPYNKPIIDLACSVCTVKYQTSVFCILKNLSLIFQYRPIYIYIYIYIYEHSGPMTLCACVDALVSPCCTACVW